MLNAFYDAVHGVDDSNVVITGGTAPYGEPPGHSRMRPLVFLRKLLCLRNRTALAPTNCPKPPKLDVLAHHPINTSGSPHRSALHPDDASTPDFKNVGKVLRAAERQTKYVRAANVRCGQRSSGGRASPPTVLRRSVGQAGALLRRDPLSTVEATGQGGDQPPDPGFPVRPGHSRVNPAGRPLLLNGNAKPSAKAFRFPFVAKPRGDSRVLLWGKSPAAGELEVERKKGGDWRRVKRLRRRCRRGVYRHRGPRRTPGVEGHGRGEQPHVVRFASPGVSVN